MKDYFDKFDSTTAIIDKVSFIDFIVNNGYYRDFKVFSARYPQVKSRKKLAIMFLRHINKYHIARDFVFFRINRSMKELSKVSYL